jgi:TPR repeat protein
MQWFQKAADGGGEEGMHNIGVLYENGWGVARNHGEAIKWYRKASAKGYDQAKEALKRLGVE